VQRVADLEPARRGEILARGRRALAEIAELGGTLPAPAAARKAA
jgi:hypothetical protein